MLWFSSLCCLATCRTTSTFRRSLPMPSGASALKLLKRCKKLIFSIYTFTAHTQTPVDMWWTETDMPLIRNTSWFSTRKAEFDPIAIQFLSTAKKEKIMKEDVQQINLHVYRENKFFTNEEDTVLVKNKTGALIGNVLCLQTTWSQLGISSRWQTANQKWHQGGGKWRLQRNKDAQIVSQRLTHNWEFTRNR